MLRITEPRAGHRYPGRSAAAPWTAIQAANRGADPIVSRKTSATGGTFPTSSLRSRSNPAQPRLQATTRRRAESGRDMGAGEHISSSLSRQALSVGSDGSVGSVGSMRRGEASGRGVLNYPPHLRNFPKDAPMNLTPELVSDILVRQGYL